jgi:hypothetical protein
MSSGDSWLRLWSGRSRCLPGPGADVLLRGGDLGYDGPSLVLTSSFEVEILPPVSPSEVRPDSVEGGDDAEGAAAPSIDV